MKKLIIAVLMMCLIGGVGVWPASADTATLGWDAPTHRAGGTLEAPECGTQGAVLTAAEIATIQYTFSYRVKGTQAWTNVETTGTTVTLPNLPFNTTYQAAVGGHWPNGAVACATEMIEFTTSVGPPPGSCTGLKRIPTP
jgi:hypothetical protein